MVNNVEVMHILCIVIGQIPHPVVTETKDGSTGLLIKRK